MVPIYCCISRTGGGFDEGNMTSLHLSIVGCDPVVRTDQATRHRIDQDGQYELDFFNEETRSFLIVAMDEVHGLKLLSEIERVHPSIVLDLRSILRFDQPGISRAKFFGILNRTDAVYCREDMHWSKIKIRHMGVSAHLPQRLFHEAVERWEGNIALLVSKNLQARHLETMLNLTLSQWRPSGWGIEKVG